MRAALRHPFGLTLLIASLVLAVLGAFMGRWELFSIEGVGIVLLGVLAYFASAIVLHLWRDEVSAPELRKLDSIRQFMETKLKERRANEGPSAFTRILSEAISHVERQIRPSLHELLKREHELSDLLKRYDDGKLPPPEPDVLKRLRQSQDRKRATIDECVQQASNAAGTLVAIIQEGDDESAAALARTWAGDLLAIHDVIKDAIRDEDEQRESEGHAEYVEDGRTASAKSNSPSTGEPSSNGGSSEEFRDLVQEALRQLSNPAALSECRLACKIPETLFAFRSQSGDGATVEPTPLEQAQALREVLVSAIEGLKPTDDNVQARTPGALQYHILHEQYVQKVPISYITVRLNIGESTFHRNRRDAVYAVARHLEMQEELIAANRSSASSSPLRL